MGGKTLGKISLILVGIGIIISIIGYFLISSSSIGFLLSSFYPLLFYSIPLVLSLIFGVLSIKKNNKVLGILAVVFSIVFVVISSIFSFVRVVIVY